MASRAPSWVPAVAASLAFHAVIGAVLFLGRAQRDQTMPPEQQAMAIEIMAAPAAPPTPPRDIPPGPERVENRQSKPIEQKTEIDLPPAPAFTDVKPEVVIPPKQRNTAEPPNSKPVATETTAQAAPPAPPKPVAAATAQGAPTAAMNRAQQTWEGLILAKIERRKHYPGEAQRLGQQDLVYVDVTIDRTGRVLRANIEKSRNMRLLDNAALEAVRRASPLPAPPDSEKGDIITFAIPIEFYLKH